MALARRRRVVLFGCACIALASAAGPAEERAHPMPRSTALIPLPEARLDSDVALENALRHRRSVRDFANQSLSLADAAQLLWAAQGITTRDGLRTAPSADALYPLELYLVAGRIDSLEPGAYRYVPKKHALERGTAGDVRVELARAALGQDWIASAPAVVVLAAVFDRTTAKYGTRGRRYVHMEVGHAAQDVCLQAVALGLGACVVGAFDDSAVQQVLGLPEKHEPLALLPVGHPQFKR